MDLEISVAFEKPPEEGILNFPLIYGGINVNVGGHDLIRFEEHEQLNARYADQAVYPKYDSSGTQLDAGPYDYIGEHLNPTLRSFIETAITFRKNDFDRFQELPVEISSESRLDYIIVMSFVDGAVGRIAFQPNRDRSELGGPVPTREVSLGYIFDPNSLCEGLIDANLEYLEYVKRGLDQTEKQTPGYDLRELRDDIQSENDQLRQLIDQ